MIELRKTGVALALAGGLGLALAAGPAPPALAIVDGERVAAQDAPWAASLLVRLEPGRPWRHACSATVVGPRRVLTARHCVEHDDAWRAVVAVGSDAPERAGGRRVPVARIWSIGLLDPDAPPSDADIPDLAVVETVRDVGVPALPPAAAGSAPADGASLWAYGFGHTDQEQSRLREPALLRRARLESHSPAECAETDIGGDPTVLCATRAAGPGAGIVAPGDSGGGLVEDGPQGPALVGVNSAITRGPMRGRLAIFAAVGRARAFVDAPERGVELPRPTGRPVLTGAPRVGARVRCRVRFVPRVRSVRVGWIAAKRGARDLTFASGPRGLRVPAAARGRTLACEATGSIGEWYGARSELSRAMEVRG